MDFLFSELTTVNWFLGLSSPSANSPELFLPHVQIFPFASSTHPNYPPKLTSIIFTDLG